MAELITKITWRSLSPELEALISDAARRWIGTPYMSCQCARGQAVDCVRLVAGVYDTLAHTQLAKLIDRRRHDSGLHKAKMGFEVVRQVRKLFNLELVRDNCIEPGDTIVVRGESGDAPLRPAHGMFAVAEKYQAIHAVLRGGVCKTSLQVTSGIIRIYRPRNKEMWLQ